MPRSLPPERYHCLQVRLDRVRRSAESCNRALVGLADGTLTRAEFERFLAELQGAHRAWIREAEAERVDA
jgi:hypothetical protein